MEKTSALLDPDASEGSVDIYDGLDVCISSSAAESPRAGSRLKESMDLYEELVTEEEQNKEASYAELKSRFQAAQNQIQELRHRLEQMEMKNSGLTNENCCLKKNISALLQTARQEVKRKDAEIMRLTQRSEKSPYHPQPHINLQDPNRLGRTTTITSSSKPQPPPPPPSGPPVPPLPTCSRQQEPPARDPAHSCRKESTEMTRASKPSSHGHSRRDCEAADKHKSKCKEEKHQSEKLPETSNRRHQIASDPSKQFPASEQSRSHRVEGRRHDTKLSKSKVWDIEDHIRSDRAKTGSPEISHLSHSDKKGSSRERKPDKTNALRSSKDIHNREREERKNMTSGKWRDSKEQKKVNHHAERYNDSSKERKTRDKNHQSKEDRLREDNQKHKRDSQSETSKRRRSREEKQEKTLKIFPEESDEGKKNSVHEKSPNRKLCFMETLNLTLSPIKKPGSSSSVCQENLPEGQDVRKTADGNNSLPNFEDMFVIDEIDVSESEAGFSEVAIPFLNNLNVLTSQEQLDCVKDVQETEKITHSQPNDTAKKEVTVLLKSKSPESVSCKAREDLQNHLDKVGMDSESQADDRESAEATESRNPNETSGSVSKQQTNCHLQTDSGNDTESSAAVQEQVDSSAAPPKPAVPESSSRDSPRQLVVTSSSTAPNTDVTENTTIRTSPKSQESPAAVPPWGSAQEPGPPAVSPLEPGPPAVSPQEPGPPAISPQEPGPPAVSPQEPGPPAVSPQEPGPPAVPPQEPGPPAVSPQEPGPPAVSPENQSSGRRDSSKDPAAVPSIISLESLPQEGLSLMEAILVLAHEDTSDTPAEPSSSTGSIGVFDAGSRIEEKIPERLEIPPITPQKRFGPAKNQAPSGSVPFIHDEDSMMRTLSSLKRIPDAISPLRSPVQIAKRNLSHLHGKPGHVKSLQKDFSSAPADASSKKLDVNKENKYPGSPANRDMPNVADKVSDVSSGLSDTDLEEGEIESESDEATASSPAPATKKAKLAVTVINKASPKSVLRRKHEEKCGASKETHETAAASTRSPRSRFKTVCPAATKASFSTIDDIMETFKLVRTEIRKKYMKLHKTFPKKSFYGVMENFQESFLEFVDGAHFGQICSHATELKSKLKKLITSVFSKVSNNGIVKRIFEQQAVDMKQKLWDFVDAQVNYLFREIDTTLQGFCKPIQTNDKKSSRRDKSSRQSPTRRPHCQKTEAQSPSISLNPSRPGNYKTGLGSRGKDIRITHVDKEGKTDLNPPNGPQSQAVVEFLPPKILSLTPEKNRPLVFSHNGPLVDKTDFQLLTEQQASSLTFNLVRDSQMGEIFKCLLQGSDLLESSGENSAWTLTSPRKDGERFFSVATPTKFDSSSKLLSSPKLNTPTKLVAAWASISPRKHSSPRLKESIHLNPALFDESCMLEVPSETGVQTQKSFSILAEDLAVSLTIPSPLKSDSHLSFLQPSSTSMHLMSTPDSVISAHISEDALMDGEDATEQDIHLALDTDNSSCDPSSSSGASSPLATPFIFKPDIPMQALVMEKSNDHFIVKIRQASGSIMLTDEDSLDRTLTEEPQYKEDDAAGQESQIKTGFVEKSHEPCCSSSPLPSKLNPSNLPEHSTISQATAKSNSSLSHKEKRKLMINSHKKKASFLSPLKSCFNKSETNLTEAVLDDSLDTGFQNTNDCTIIAEDCQTGPGKDDTPPKCLSEVLSLEPQKTISPSKGIGVGLQHHLKRSNKDQQSGATRSNGSDSKKDETEASESEKGRSTAEDTNSLPQKSPTDHNVNRKRKKHQKKSKAKRSKEEETMKTSSAKKDEESQTLLASLSPNSLSAKNVVRKKGEVVIAWTRDEDRAILIALKTKGASQDTFFALSEKLNKPSEQIAHRFHQLMKLFKKMDS